MKRVIISALVFGTLAALTGCGSSFSSIRQVSGNTYLVTRTRNGLISTSGDLLRCEASGETMNCTQVGTP